MMRLIEKKFLNLQFRSYLKVYALACLVVLSLPSWTSPQTTQHLEYSKNSTPIYYKMTETSCPGTHAATGAELNINGTVTTNCFESIDHALPFIATPDNEFINTSLNTNHHSGNNYSARVCEHYVNGDWKTFLESDSIFSLRDKVSFINKNTLVTIGQEKLSFAFVDIDSETPDWVRIDLEKVDSVVGDSFENSPPTHPNDLEEEVKKVINRIEKGIKKTALFCQGLATVSNSKNYSDSAFSSNDNYNSMKSNPQFALQQCMGRPDQQLCVMQAMQMVEMECTHKGPVTLDYKICKKIIMTIDGFFMGNQVVQAVQGVQATSKAQEQTLDQQTKLMKGEGFDETYGLELQKSSTETQANMAGQRAAINAAELAALTGLLNSMPTRKKIFEKCKAAPLDNAVTSSWTAPIAYPDYSKEKACEDIAYNPYIPGLFQNLKIRESVKTAMFEAGRNAAENAAKMAILNDQAGKIQGAINDINAYQPQEYDNTPFCQANPEDPLCKVPTVGRGEIGTDVVTGEAFTVDDSSAFEDVLNEDPTVSYGGTNNDSSNGGFLDDGPSIGGAKTTPTSHGGSGGGGGPGNVAAPGGGPSAGGDSAPAKPSGPNGIKMATSGGAGSLRLSGGSGGANRDSSSSTKNPFSKLLGKKDKSGGLLNFRSPASIAGKKGSLFFMITNRYGEVAQQKDRLLEYKEKK